MTGVPGVRLHGLGLAIDALRIIGKWLDAERLALADTLGPDAPPVKRMQAKVGWIRIVVAQLKADASEIKSDVVSRKKDDAQC